MVHRGHARRIKEGVPESEDAPPLPTFVLLLLSLNCAEPHQKRGSCALKSFPPAHKGQFVDPFHENICHLPCACHARQGGGVGASRFRFSFCWTFRSFALSLQFPQVLTVYTACVTLAKRRTSVETKKTRARACLAMKACRMNQRTCTAGGTGRSRMPHTCLIAPSGPGPVSLATNMRAHASPAVSPQIRVATWCKGPL